MADTKVANAILARLVQQSEAMSGLVESVESSLADLSDPKRLEGIERVLSAQEAILAELTEAVAGNNIAKALDGVSKAIADAAKRQVAQPAPIVNNHIQPSTVTVEAILPQGPAPVVNIHPPANKPQKWRVRLAATSNSPSREMTIEQIP